ncbi:putative cytochrome c oxidase subunit VIa [Eremomyces bilateralis CBS 781.70]|uniref:Cytochrome c oxidase subunit n=1 Tax=Eremomyces bilateralis CBS 781.70 TaxID=1392243 RepID=A0A6G1FYX8_9PEZI|nr:putative cytochrome c oxidase subunit VIa [Eremomyces bilateralis CBS 781.70]KAF1811075.1 putative cytochrome c oxidase subunit VIa [Eremomyces bilateralis CBS 781.70]
MLSQQLVARSARAVARSTRQPAVRSAGRRQYSGAQKFEGAQDNAFNRERAAVKQHASETTDLWRKLSIYGIIPAVLLTGINAYNQWNEHWEHVSHEPPRSEKPEYSYQNIRTKNFCWGDGDKTLFWNDNVNYHKED